MPGPTSLHGQPNTADQLRSGAPAQLAGGAQGGTSARSTGAALSFVSCILFGSLSRPSHKTVHDGVDGLPMK